jgi:hypothetical protein
MQPHQQKLQNLPLSDAPNESVLREVAEKIPFIFIYEKCGKQALRGLLFFPF